MVESSSSAAYGTLVRACHGIPWAILLGLGALAFFAMPWGLGLSLPWILGFGAAMLAVAGSLVRSMPRFSAAPRHAGRWFLVIVGLGIAIRLAYVLAVPPVQLSDMADYVGLARGLLRGEGYHQQVFGADLVAFRAPGYSFLLAGAMALVGDSGWTPTLLNLLAYVVTSAMLWDLTSRIAGRLAPIVAVGLFACWPSGVMSAGLAMTEHVSLLSLLAVAWGVERGRSEPRRPWWLVTGVALGLGALVRPSLLPLPGLVLFLALLDSPARRVALRHAALAVLVAVVCVAPWTLRNYLVLHAFVPVSTNGGDNFYRSNNPLATGSYTPKAEKDFSAMLPDEVGWNRANMEAGKRWISEHPLDFLRLSARKAAMFVADDSTGAYWSLERAHREIGPVYTFANGVSNVWWLGVWLFAVVALLRWRTRVLDDSAGAALMWLTIVLPVVHSVFESQPRYHMPIVGVLLCLSAMLFASPKSSEQDSIARPG